MYLYKKKDVFKIADDHAQLLTQESNTDCVSSNTYLILTFVFQKIERDNVNVISALCATEHEED